MKREMRLHPRVGVDMPAELEPYGSDSLDVRLVNLSVGGALIEGSEQLESLLNAVRHPESGVPVEVNLHFGLEEGPVHCHCRLIHTRRLAQSRYQMGMKILSLASDCQDMLSRFVESRLQAHH
ncbi:hypothetical protein GCM10011348_38630 [Marinobacterium nitratireducens]|uniref:PilZ domain-containing protein n=1 Tax=Marinobacterium nitratireducens TaxID=518897 RepID=A0A917ZNP2_9GAMM|nr:PilZ domain-containing protein [Marinobacterium nitratireducens]GGO86830.1 hypothetical protein GCM10011348_38630 [Marinobacterium nitratireducens]